MAIRSQENKFSAAQTLGITLRKLEEVTEVYNPLLEKDARYLEEIFRLAKLEERYKNGEIGETDFRNQLNQADLEIRL